MNQLELAADLYRQIAFSAAILGGFSMTYLGVLLTSFKAETRVSMCSIGALTVASSLFIVATLGATLLLIGVRQLGLGFNFADWPSGLMRTKRIVEFSLLLSVSSLMLGLGVSGFLRSRRMGYLTAAPASIATVLLLLIFVPTF